MSRPSAGDSCVLTLADEVLCYQKVQTRQHAGFLIKPRENAIYDNCSLEIKETVPIIQSSSAAAVTAIAVAVTAAGAVTAVTGAGAVTATEPPVVKAVVLQK